MFKIVLYFSLVLLFSGMGIIPESMDLGGLIVHLKDIGFVILIFLTIGSRNVVYKKDRVYTLILYVLCLIIHEFLTTGIFGILVTNREWLYSLLIIGRLNQFENKTRTGVINFVISVTFLHAIFYVLQSGFNLFNLEYVLLENGSRRYLCSPYLLFLAHILVLQQMKGLKRNLVLICFLFCSYFTGSEAALFISLISLVVASQNVFVRLQSSMQIFLVSFLSLLIIYKIQDLTIFKNIRYISLNNLIDYYHGDTISFRLAIVYERLIFLITNGYIWFGYTLYPDMLFQTKLFVLGTHNESYPFGIEQLQSADIMWPGLFMRLGLLGALFYLRCFASYFGNNFMTDIGLGLILLLVSLNSGMMNSALVLILYFWLIDPRKVS